METTSAVVFIGAVIVGLTELFKAVWEKDYRTAVLIGVAALVGALVGAFDVQLGVTNISVAQGVMAGLAASGAYKVASKIG